ncbi:interferon-inducible GTPase 5-like [Clarias magur]|uniref:Interferon-inducible GTPase 5-like n=1 Tax=Clarias magur TaxID=1594786 RepID=A0A8J4X0B6_CLAMG|nr:interferon-inducible GTPase 5-like [Clarias magur]
MEELENVVMMVLHTALLIPTHFTAMLSWHIIISSMEPRIFRVFNFKPARLDKPD